MLLELSCKNFKSIRKKITFSMVASNDNSHEEELYKYKTYRVSRISSLYGINGAGKTALIDAVGYMSFLVRECSKFQEGDRIPRVPHKMMIDKPTEFNIQFVEKGVRYAYGFILDDNQVIKEYLYHYPAGRQAKIFEREKTVITYGATYKKELGQLENKSKRNKLFLSTAEAWSSIEEIVNPFRFFKEKMIVHSNGPDDWFHYSAEQVRSNPEVKNLMIRFFQRIGIPIRDIVVKIENRKLTTQDMPAEMLSKIKAISGSLMSNVIEVRFVYKDYELDIQEESLGTQKLFNLLCPLMDVLVNGKILFYDELEDSLHPALVDEIIKTFKGWKNEKTAQLVFSTHDTSLLDLDLFRRDQIWFAERNQVEAESEYYSLVELKNVRKDENIKKGYITGRYSKIPLRGCSLIEVLGDKT